MMNHTWSQVQAVPDQAGSLVVSQEDTWDFNDTTEMHTVVYIVCSDRCNARSHSTPTPSSMGLLRRLTAEEQARSFQ